MRDDTTSLKGEQDELRARLSELKGPEHAACKRRLGEIKRAIKEIEDSAVDGTRDIYPDHQLAMWAYQQGCDTSELARRYILTCAEQSRWYVFSEGGYIGVPAGNTSAIRALLTRLPIPDKLIGAPYELLRYNVSTVVPSHRHPYWTYDVKTQTLYQPRFIPRVQPVAWPEVQEWLDVLGGARVDYLLDWLHYATQLDYTSNALYLYGAAGAGKSTLARGLARIYGASAATPFRSASGAYTPALDSPIVVSDEHDGEVKSSIIRDLVGAPVFHSNQKYKPQEQIKLNVRYVLCSNDLQLLSEDEVYSRETLRGVIDRVIPIDVGPAARTYIASMSYADRVQFVDQKLPEHLLHLGGDQYTPRTQSVLGQRFPVQFDDLEAPEILRLQLRSLLNSDVCAWVLGAILRPSESHEVRAHRMVRIIDGQVYLWTSQAINKHFRVYLPDLSRVPHYKRVAESVKCLSIGTRAIDRRMYAEISPAILRIAAEERGESVEALNEALRRGM